MYKFLLITALMGLLAGPLYTAPAPSKRLPDTVSLDTIQGHWAGTCYMYFRDENEADITTTVEVTIIDRRVSIKRYDNSPICHIILVVDKFQVHTYDNWEYYTPDITESEMNFIYEVKQFDYNKGILEIRKSSPRENLIEKWELRRQ